MIETSFEICREYHSDLLQERIAASWNGAPPLLLVPPGVENSLPATTLSFPEPPVFGLLTSGTLGAKVIFYSRRNIEASLRGIFSFFDIDRIDSVFTYPQPYHVFGLALGYVFCHLYGKTLLLPEGVYSRKAHENWADSVGKGTLTLGTPTHFRDLVNFIETEKRTPTPSYSAIIGGAAVSREIWEKTRDKLSIEAPSIGYGASELSPGATHLPPGRAPKEDGEMGVPLPNVHLEIHPGKGLRATGENVCLAVSKNGETRFPQEIWLHDEVRLREDGVMVFHNRTDLLLNRGGEKFPLEKIETEIWNQFQIKAVGVTVSHQRLGEELALIVEDSPQFSVERENIYRFLKSQWGRDFDPSFFYSVERFPIDRNSKIDRRALRQIAESNERISH